MNSIETGPLSRRVHDGFVSRFGYAPHFTVHAPGRINLIGEHTDYNAGFVLPGAIEQGICFAIAPTSQAHHTWHALDTGDAVEPAVNITHAEDRGWADYLLGACAIMKQERGVSSAMHCVFAADLPAGAGLSSSSALTCGMLLALDAIHTLQLERAQLALYAHRAEREYIGLQGGIMDQHACLLSMHGHLLLLDCLDRSYHYVPFPDKTEIELLLVNTRVQHKLTDTDYNTRAAECRHALGLLEQAAGITTLRELTPALLTEHAPLLGPLLLKRLQYVLEENTRVHAVTDCLARKDWTLLGAHLLEGHIGLRDAYEVSCAELDFLVEVLQEVPGVMGGRMMGGGFGGCTIHVCIPGALTEETRKQIEGRYATRFGWAPEFIPVRLSDGARVWKP